MLLPELVGAGRLEYDIDIRAGTKTIIGLGFGFILATLRFIDGPTVKLKRRCHNGMTRALNEKWGASPVLELSENV